VSARHLDGEFRRFDVVNGAGGVGAVEVEFDGRPSASVLASAAAAATGIDRVQGQNQSQHGNLRKC